MKNARGTAVLTIVLAGLSIGAAQRVRAEDTAKPAAAGGADDVLYDDDTAKASATGTQVMPNSSTSNMTLDNVRRIRVKNDILIIEWGGTVITFLPKQFVSAMTINKRNGPKAAP